MQSAYWNIEITPSSFFRPLIRGFFFYSIKSFEDTDNPLKWFPSPHSGILFLYDSRKYVHLTQEVLFPSPHSGILFLCAFVAALISSILISFPSPHSGILFLYPKVLSQHDKSWVGFRPLIRGFFFYFFTNANNCAHWGAVSVPSFGDSFFMSGQWLLYSNIKQLRFRPLIRGFFFYVTLSVTLTDRKASVFPSPHSGILFLW